MSSQTPIVRGALTALWVLVPVMAVADVALNLTYWVFGLNVLGDNLVVLAPRPPASGRQVTGLVATFPGMAAWLAALLILHGLLRRFRGGEVISLTTVSGMRAFALLSFLSALLDTATSGARRWAQGEFNGPIWTHIQVSSDQLWLLFIAAAFLVMSSALVEATVYKDEADSYL